MLYPLLKTAGPLQLPLFVAHKNSGGGRSVVMTEACVATNLRHIDDTLTKDDISIVSSSGHLIGMTTFNIYVDLVIYRFGCETVGS